VTQQKNFIVRCAEGASTLTGGQKKLPPKAGKLRIIKHQRAIAIVHAHTAQPGALGARQVGDQWELGPADGPGWLAVEIVEDQREGRAESGGGDFASGEGLH